jgi:hypothetical protein
MKKIVIFLISAILSITYVNLSAQTEEGCSFRFVLESPSGFGWNTGYGITVTVDDVEYGFVTLPWGTPSAEETIIVPSGEVHFVWTGYTFSPNSHYFEIYNSLDELIYTSPEMIPDYLFFIYQNECPKCIPLTDFEGEYIPETKQVNLSWTAPTSVHLTGFDIFRNDALIDHVAPTAIFYSDHTAGLAAGDYKYCVVPVYPFSCDLEDECFETTIPVGINNYSSGIRLFPNPASNVVHLSGTDRAAVKVFNSMGQLMNSYDNVNSVSVSSYKTGIYFFNVATIDGDVGVFKVVVTK